MISAPSTDEIGPDMGRLPTPEATGALPSLAALLADIRGRDVGAVASEASLALESIEAVELRSAIECEIGVDVPLDLFFSDCSLARIAEAVAASGSEPRDVAQMRTAPAFAPDPARRHEPFELTDVQQAYWLGRSTTFRLGGRSAHFYLDLDVHEVPVARIEQALVEVIDRHDMLRAIVRPDGRQQVLETVPDYRIACDDLRGLRPAEAERRLAATRDAMSHRVFAADRWPLYEVRAHELDNTRVRLHIGIDLLLLDAGSIAMLLAEWLTLAAGVDGGADGDPPGLTFRDYVESSRRAETAAGDSRARDYWMNRLAGLPAAPQLPAAATAQCSAAAPRFTRRAVRLDAATWSRLRERAREGGVTPSVLLCTAYVEVLRTWSATSHFTLNVTVSDRPRRDADVRRILGDFTSTVLLECEAREPESFAMRADRLQRQLLSDLEHRQFSGVRVLRELGRAGFAAAAPVVFTSVLEEPDRLAAPAGMRVDEVFAVSQTPQVMLDNQVVQRGGELAVSWDATDALFEPGVVDDMFDAYCRLLRHLADDSAAPDAPVAGLVPGAQLRLRERINATTIPQPQALLHAGFERQAQLRPDAPAIVAPDRTLTYAELDRLSNHLARSLRELGARPNELVAVVMHKGWEQIAAVLAVLRSGAAYLPIDAALPAARIEHLLAAGEARIALTQPSTAARLDGLPAVTTLAVRGESALRAAAEPLPAAQTLDDLAYVIFTSGSTGEPKGVAIDHRGAVNTVADVNRRLAVGPGDSVLALSSLSFDLSVYDIFGLLAAGGAIVLPEARASRDPAHWRDLVERHRVTIWNSVPALLELLVEDLEHRRSSLPASVRVAMLSGDWIPTTLPQRVRALVADDPVLLSLGGATEASVWSIMFPIGVVDAAWPSIPYGRPMDNQTFHVLDERLEPRPELVQGELFIGGIGLAREYWRDAARTAERFVIHPRTGERLYRTGDLGRWLRTGDIEFLGRADSQVKVAGHRIELGEIESVLAGHPQVKLAVVAARGERQGPKRLAGYVVAVDATAPPAAQDIRAFLAERLPSYMVPPDLVTLAALPLTRNGKVDRAGLPAPKIAARPLDAAGAEAPETSAERTLAGIWSAVLGIDAIGRHDHFFELGGDSLLGVRVLARAAEAGLWLTPDDLYSHPTIAGLAAVARSSPAGDAPQGVVEGPVALTPSQQWFFGQAFDDAHHWNGMWPLFELDRRVDGETLRIAFEEVLLHHDALRMRFKREPAGWSATIAGRDAALDADVMIVNLEAVPEAERTAALERRVAERHASLDLVDGPLVCLTCFKLGAGRPSRLLVSAHWLAMDYYASRVFFDDLRTAYTQADAGQEVVLPPKTASMPQVLGHLAEQASSAELEGQIPLWARQAAGAPPLPVDRPDGHDAQGSVRRIEGTLDGPAARAILRDLPLRLGAEVKELLLTALLRAATDWTGNQTLHVELEGIGREQVLAGLEVSRTVGRLSTLSPVLLERGDGLDAEAELVAVIAALREIPQHGAGYGMLRYLHPDEAVRRTLASVPQPELGFNYWGDVSEYYAADMRPVREAFGPHRSPRGHRPRLVDFMALASGGGLLFGFTYSANVHDEGTIAALSERFVAELHALSGAVV